MLLHRADEVDLAHVGIGAAIAEVLYVDDAQVSEFQGQRVGSPALGIA